MTGLNFQESVLYMTPRSPFARRVRLAFIENAIKFEEKSVDVFHPDENLIKMNPLARVPVLKLKSGEVLVDSTQILLFFYQSHPSPMAPLELQDQLMTAYWSAVAVGLSEKIVEYYLEALKPEEKRDAELLTEVDRTVLCVLSRLNGFIGHRKFLLPSGIFSQADLDLGTALAYLSFRYSDGWREQYPRAALYLDGLEKRLSFQMTRPVSA